MSRPAGITVLVIALLGLTSLLSYQHMARHKRRQLGVMANLREAIECGAKISAFRRQPTIAAASDDIAGEVETLIESFAHSAGIESASLARITPEPAQRLADSDYKAKPTRVRMTDVTLEQLVAFLHGLVSTHAGVTTQSIHIRAPRPDDVGKLWITEIVLTYLVYDPPGSGGSH